MSNKTPTATSQAVSSKLNKMLMPVLIEVYNAGVDHGYDLRYRDDVGLSEGEENHRYGGLPREEWEHRRQAGFLIHYVTGRGITSEDFKGNKK